MKRRINAKKKVRLERQAGILLAKVGQRKPSCQPATPCRRADCLWCFSRTCGGQKKEAKA
jgi:hypothetical protein